MDIRMATPVAIKATKSTTTPMTMVLRRILSLLQRRVVSRTNDRPCRGRAQVSREGFSELSQSPDGSPSGLDVGQRFLDGRKIEAEEPPGRRHMARQRRFGRNGPTPWPWESDTSGMEM